MKKNKMMRLASLLLVCVLLTTSVISGTFAKYTSNATAYDQARVAKWSFKVGGQNIATSEPITFDLFNTINDTGNTTKEYDVAAGKIIAPGTAGSFTIEMENTSEVTARYAINFEILENGIGDHIWFKVGDGQWKNSLDNIAFDDVATKIGIGGTASVTVEWKWDFADGSTEYDEIDTDLGIDAAAGNAAILKVQATITAEQVD